MSQPVTAAPEPVPPSTGPVSDDDYLKWFDYYQKLADRTPPKPWPKALQQQVAAAAAAQTAESFAGSPASAGGTNASLDFPQQPAPDGSPSINDMEGWARPPESWARPAATPVAAPGYADQPAADQSDGQWNSPAWDLRTWGATPQSAAEGGAASVLASPGAANAYFAPKAQTWEPSAFDRAWWNLWAGHQTTPLGLLQSVAETNVPGVLGGSQASNAEARIRQAMDMWNYERMAPATTWGGRLLGGGSYLVGAGADPVYLAAPELRLAGLEGMIGSAGAGMVARGVGSGLYNAGTDTAMQLVKLADGRQDHFDRGEATMAGGFGLAGGLIPGFKPAEGESGAAVDAAATYVAPTLTTIADDATSAARNSTEKFTLAPYQHAPPGYIRVMDEQQNQFFQLVHSSDPQAPARLSLDDVVLSNPLDSSKLAKSHPDGSFSISDWSGYHNTLPKPYGPFNLLKGIDVFKARYAANQANKALRKKLGLKDSPVEIHEIHPVKFGGSPTDLANKIIVPKSVHKQKISPWWYDLQTKIESGKLPSQ